MSSFHDSEVVAIEIGRSDGTLSLRFALAGGGTKSITAIGVSHFRSVDVILQNVVSRLRLSSENDFLPEEIARSLRWVTSLDDGSTFATDEQIALLQADILEKRSILLVIEPSWGAEIIVVAKIVSVS